MTGILDMRTILFGYVLSSAICLAVVAPLWTANRKRRPEIGYWLADYVLQFIALFLIAMRGTLPDFVSIVVGNTLIVGGTILLHVGLRRFLDRQRTEVHNWAMLAVFAVAMTYFAFVRPDMAARNVTLSLALLFICAQIAWLMLRRVAPELRPSTRGVGLVMAGYGALSLLRIFVDLAGPHINSLFASGFFDTATILAYEMLFIALTFALLLMVNSRLITELERDIVVRELAETRLRELSDHDPLTGVLNSRAFERAATDRLAKIGTAHAALVYLDLDLLKETNDRFGHPTGDAALVGLAGALTRAFRESDIIGRLGGDEFAVLAISREAVADDVLVARFATELARTNSDGTVPLEVSASLGIATTDETDGAPDLQVLTKAADRRMYEAKRRRHVRES